MTFAERLRELREKVGMTQAALAEACDIPLGTLREYEQGKRRQDPSLRITVRLASALGVTCEAFADCVNEEAKPRRRPGKGRPAAARRTRR